MEWVRLDFDFDFAQPTKGRTPYGARPYFVRFPRSFDLCLLHYYLIHVREDFPNRCHHHA